MLRTHSDHTQDTQCTCTGHTLSCKQDTQNKHCSTQDTLRTRGDNTQDTHRTHNAHTQDTHYHENRTHTGHTYLLSAQVPPPPLQMSWARKEGLEGFMSVYPLHKKLLDWFVFKPLRFEYTNCILQVLHTRNQPLWSSMVWVVRIARWHPLSLLWI